MAPKEKSGKHVCYCIIYMKIFTQFDILNLNSPFDFFSFVCGKKEKMGSNHELFTRMYGEGSSLGKEEAIDGERKDKNACGRTCMTTLQ